MSIAAVRQITASLIAFAMLGGCATDGVVLTPGVDELVEATPTEEASTTAWWPVELAITEVGFADAALTTPTTARRIVWIRDWTNWRDETIAGPLAGFCQIREPTASRSGSAGCDGPWEFEHTESPLHPTGIDPILRPAGPEQILTIRSGPLHPQVRPELLQFIDDLGLDRNEVSTYSHTERLECGAIAADICGPDDSTFLLEQELIIHDPTGLPLVLVGRPEGRQVYRYLVTDIAFNGAAVDRP